VEAVVDNPGRTLLPGQYVTMEFVTGDRGAALTLPVAAVSRLGPQATVWVVKEDRVEARPVATGLQSADRVEITQGLEAGERAVVQGREGLYGGARVRETAAGGAAAAGSGAAPPGAAHEHAAPPAPAEAPAAPAHNHGAPAATPKDSGHAGH
jgi:hypothetical protein